MTANELDSLRAKVERLTGLLNAKTTPGYELLAATIVAKDAEILRLRAEWIELLNWLNTHHPHVAIAFARRALEGK